jgi:predicted Zn-dependent protease
MFVVALAVMSTACGVSTQQEIEIGQQNAAQINAQLPIVQDAEVNRYINVLGDQIANLTSRADLPWTFYVVNDPNINAFAVPGGFIYVNRGLIEKTTTLSQLASVLGHEIGHVVERHSVEQMGQMNAANIGVGLACILTNVCNSQVGQVGIQAAGSALFAKFSRDDEREADRVGIENVVRAGIHPKGAPEMFQILLDARTSQPGLMEGWFATHPTDEQRIRDTQAQVNAINPAVLRTLIENTAQFTAFKNRVRSLPAAPRR